ncbi:peptidoglycan editing factor PgeF [Nitrosomonas sp.]|uniref:peptidoglycan editing factor PgeF n=1 Tax=Nitrosomonas sp. TaxID=42353 RepID=UPI001DFDA89A|nr:peptidoglycan editing factor PgeF [Nitrosomonas sp.]MBX3616894.1 peptidoglycan editing factor PgeF [Nitrosomonas sp.]
MITREDWIIPDWPAPDNVRALFTTRNGGVSSGARGMYASLNLGAHVNDELENVTRNRAIVRRHLPREPKWLKQVHGTLPVQIEHTATIIPEADAAFSRRQKHVCAVMVADCLPVLLCDQAGTVVGVVHAGWRGLAGGIIENTVEAMQVDPHQLMAWLGPAIGPNHFEVGADVHAAFVQHEERAVQAFQPKFSGDQAKWLADIFLLARQRLNGCGISKVYGGGVCTYSDSNRFYSYRRDGGTGRMAALIWFE